MAKNPSNFETPFETYTVSGVLGEGGSGRVFSVTNSAGNMFALKCLFPALITTDKKKRFKNEIDFCRRQSHRNIIHVIDSGLARWGSSNTPFYVMPFFPMTLRDLMDKHIPPDKVLPLFSQMSDGVEAAHLLGVFHRDLKPENFLYDPEQNLIVAADFGIAHFEEDLLVTLIDTKPTARLANFAYSAPEQRIKGTKVDYRADIYSIGLILNEMFTGTIPHGAGYILIGSVAQEYAYLDSLVEHMIQQFAEARPSALEEVKKELIGRQNAFVSLQSLDAVKREVITTTEPQQVVPVNLIGADWNHGTLSLQLDRVPEPGWVKRFKDPRSGYSSVSGADPRMFSFNGNIATVHAEDRNVQRIIDYFKNYLQMATRSYQEELKDIAVKQERDLRLKLAQDIAEAEKRERVLKNLKI